MIKDWELCPENPEIKLRHTWCPTPYKIGKYEEGQEPFDPTSGDAYCKIHKAPEPPKKYCTVSGLVANNYCPTTTTEVPEPTETCNIHKKPEPEKQKLTEGYEYRPGDPTSFIYSTLFAKCGLINRFEYSEEDYKKFLWWFAGNNFGNVTRSFLHGQWGEVTYKLVNLPHPYNEADGKFDVNVIDGVWLDAVSRRMDFTIETGITPVLIMDYKVNHMGSHWLNPRNNYGIRMPDGRLQETYDDRTYGMSHWIHYAGVQPEDIPGYNEGDITEEQAWDIIHRYDANKHYDLTFNHKVLGVLKSRFGDKFMTSFNEVKRGALWHDMRDRVLDEHDIGRNRRLTSCPFDWMQTKGTILKNYIGDVHGIKDIEDYIEAREGLRDYGRNQRVIICSDGHGDWWYKDKEGMTDEQAEARFITLAEQANEDGNYILGNGWFSNKAIISNFYVLKSKIEKPSIILRDIVELR